MQHKHDKLYTVLYAVDTNDFCSLRQYRIALVQYLECHISKITSIYLCSASESRRARGPAQSHAELGMPKAREINGFSHTYLCKELMPRHIPSICYKRSPQMVQDGTTQKRMQTVIRLLNNLTASQAPLGRQFLKLLQRKPYSMSPRG